MRSIAMASNEALSDAIASEDAVAAAAVYSEETKLLPQAIDPLAGHADTAYEIGRYGLSSVPLGAEPTIDRGK